MTLFGNRVFAGIICYIYISISLNLMNNALIRRGHQIHIWGREARHDRSRDWNDKDKKATRECKLIQPLWKTVWQYLKDLEIEVPTDPALPILDVYPKDYKSFITKTHAHVCSLRHCF